MRAGSIASVTLGENAAALWFRQPARSLRRRYEQRATPTTQTRPTAPVTTNDERQELRSISQATSGALSAGPSKVPAWMQPTASPRSV